MAQCDGIIFDMDGTLWDSAENVAISWNIMLRKYPDVPYEIKKEDLYRVMGLTMPELVTKLFPDVDPEYCSKILEECGKEELSYLAKHGGMLYPKLEETLKVLSRKYKLYIVSNCQKGYIQSFFAAHHLEKYFTDFDCWGNTDLPKSETLRGLIARNQIKSPVYVGDTLGDCLATRANNIPFVWARYGFGEVTDYDYVIDSFEEMLTLDL